MRLLLLFGLVFSFLLISCSKQEEKLELFSPEAFCYSLEPGWELNSTVNIKGFTQKENKEQFLAKISYTVDLVLPNKKLVKDVFKDVVKKENNEKFMDLSLECQLELDSTYQKGDYAIVFNAKDEFSGKTAVITKLFKVE